MKRRVNSAALSPLLGIASIDPDPEVRCEALDAASRLALSEEGWRTLADTFRTVTGSLPPSAPQRATALTLAARVPLRSMRRQLQAIAMDPADTAARQVADALAEAGDSSQLDRLLDEAQRGNHGAWKALAALTLEDAGLPLERLPPPPPAEAEEARLWHALAAARIGETRWLDAFVTGNEPEPPIFHVAPSTPYAEIAAVRPLPTELEQHLIRLLPQVEGIAVHARARMASIVIGAATGVVDEYGYPTKHDGGAEDAPRGSAPLQQAIGAAREFLAAPTADRIDGIDTLGDDEVGALVTQILIDANATAATLPAGIPENQAIGNRMITLLGELPRTESWPARSLLREHLRCVRPAIDDGQLAWIVARMPPQRWIRDVSDLLLDSQHSLEQRLRILRLAKAAADCSAGHGGSPYRGAGGGGARRWSDSRTLIDDETTGAAPSDTQVGGDELGVGKPSAKGAREPNDGAVAGDERCVNAQVFHGGARRPSFVAGGPNVVRCWIGLPESGAANSDQTIPPITIPEAGLMLQVQLYWRDGSGKEHAPAGSMLLPAARTARSGDCDLSIDVPADERYVSVEVLFRHRGRVFECVRIEGPALASNDADDPRTQLRVRVQARRRETIDFVDSQLVDATIVVDQPASANGVAAARTAPNLRVFGRHDSKGFDLSGADQAIAWLNATLATTEKVVVRRQAARQPNSANPDAVTALPRLDENDPDVLQLLCHMARHGAGLYNHLARKGFVDPGERIQVLNLEPESHVPLEFVYDRGYPRDDAGLCAAGLEALHTDAATCPTCRIPAPSAELAEATVICPFGFWAIRKVIERMAPGAGTGPSLPRPSRRGLPVLDSVAFASSHLVPPEEIATTRADLQQKFPAPLFADDWQQWRAAIERRPSLLLLLPHHGTEAQLDYLEIGADTLPSALGKLSRAQLLPPIVNIDQRDPGPIVLLLGCRTAGQQETGYASITQIIQELRASIVLGTLAEVLGRHAAPVARELVAELVAVHDAQADFGTIMRRVRRRMLARGVLMSLCLVAFGDAEWRMTPRPDTQPSTSRKEGP